MEREGSGPGPEGGCRFRSGPGSSRHPCRTGSARVRSRSRSTPCRSRCCCRCPWRIPCRSASRWGSPARAWGSEARPTGPRLPTAGLLAAAGRAGRRSRGGGLGWGGESSRPGGGSACTSSRTGSRSTRRPRRPRPVRGATSQTPAGARATLCSLRRDVHHRHATPHAATETKWTKWRMETRQSRRAGQPCLGEADGA